MRRVAITGIGLVTPVGIGTDLTYKALLEGHSAVGAVTGFDASSLDTRIAAEITGLRPDDVAPRRARRLMTRSDLLAAAAAQLAFTDADGDQGNVDPARMAIFAGGGKEISDPEEMLEAALNSCDDDGIADLRRFGEQARQQVPPLFYVQGLQAGVLFHLSQTFGAQGANTFFAGGAEAGAQAIDTGFRTVRRGEADLALCGGFDAPVSWWNLSKVDAMGILSTRNESPQEACRPFDRQRDGTVLGEGAAFVVLEPLAAARRRGSRVYAEVCAVGSGYDLENLITPDPDGRALARALRATLRRSALLPNQIDFLVAHGSGTRLGDLSEARAVRQTFGDGPLVASSVKPNTGHLAGAAGALNIATAALAIQHGAVPPTLNLTEPDPECAGPWLTGSARELPVRAAVAVARGVEGQAITVALTDPDAGPTAARDDE